MFKKKKTYIILGIIVLTIVGIYYAAAKKPEMTYSTAVAEKGTILRTVSVTGRVIAPTEVNLAFKLSGQVQAMYVNVGDRVEIGQKIATIDKGTLSAQLAQAQYEIDAQKKTLADMKRREATYSYFQKDAQRERIKKAEEAANQIMNQINDTTLYAPISGIVIKKNIEIGEMVAANNSFVTIASEGELQAEVEIPESDIVDVKIGQTAHISLDAFPSEEILAAKVWEIEPASTVISDVVYYKVKLKFDAADERLKVGMSTDVDINTAEKENVIMVPMRSVKSEGEKKYVEVLQAEENLEKIFIQTGMSGDEGMIEIVSGLSGGEDVVILTNEK